MATQVAARSAGVISSASFNARLSSWQRLSPSSCRASGLDSLCRGKSAVSVCLSSSLTATAWLCSVAAVLLKLEYLFKIAFLTGDFVKIMLMRPSRLSPGEFSAEVPLGVLLSLRSVRLLVVNLICSEHYAKATG